MQKHRTFSLILLLIGMSSYCSNRRPWPDSLHTISVEHGGKPLRKTMFLNKNHWTWGMVIQENTLNDTAMLGQEIKIPPKKVGKFWRSECLMDSLPFDYRPYKATHGRLVIEYYSLPY